MATKAEAKQITGELLRIIPVGGTLQSQHDVKMGEAYDQVYGKLENMGVPLWETSASMPDEVVPAFTYLMALNKADQYPTSDNLFQRIVARVGIDGADGVNEIKSLLYPDIVDTEEPTDY